jgi:hypothetical protein
VAHTPLEPIKGKTHSASMLRLLACEEADKGVRSHPWIRLLVLWEADKTARFRSGLEVYQKRSFLVLIC